MSPPVAGGGGVASCAPTYKQGKVSVLTARQQAHIQLYSPSLPRLLMRKEGPVEGPEEVGTGGAHLSIPQLLRNCGIIAAALPSQADHWRAGRSLTHMATGHRNGWASRGGTFLEGLAFNRRSLLERLKQSDVEGS